MQHRRQGNRLRVIFVLILAVAVAAIGALLVLNPPSPATPVVKELDAKAFLEQKQ